MVVSQLRHEKRSRIVSITFMHAGTFSSVLVTSSPSLDRSPEPQQGQWSGAGTTDALTRQMVRKGAGRALAHEAFHRRGLGCCDLRKPLVLGRRLFEPGKGKLHLADEALMALGPRAIRGPPHLLGLQLQQGIAGEQIGVFSAGVGQLGRDFERARHSSGGRFPGPRKLFQELV